MRFHILDMVQLGRFPTCAAEFTKFSAND